MKKDIDYLISEIKIINKELKFECDCCGVIYSKGERPMNSLCSVCDSKILKSYSKNTY
jgi:Zn finger protein HypA/HybF involved in hydrogenase expression